MMPVRQSPASDKLPSERPRWSFLLRWTDCLGGNIAGPSIRAGSCLFQGEMGGIALVGWSEPAPPATGQSDRHRMTENTAETSPPGNWHPPSGSDVGLAMSRGQPNSAVSPIPFRERESPGESAVSEFDEGLSARFEELQRYIDWQPSDQAALRRMHPLIQLDFPAIVEDFYEEISRHHQTRLVLGDNPEVPDILRRTLRNWLDELFTGGHDREYVRTRWRVGRRHVEIGLPQVYTSAALARLRQRLVESIDGRCGLAERGNLHRALHRVIDLDHMIIQEAYRHEWVRRQAELERQQLQIEAQKTRQALAAVIFLALNHRQ